MKKEKEATPRTRPRTETFGMDKIREETRRAKNAAKKSQQDKSDTTLIDQSNWLDLDLSPAIDLMDLSLVKERPPWELKNPESKRYSGPNVASMSTPDTNSKGSGKRKGKGKGYNTVGNGKGKGGKGAGCYICGQVGHRFFECKMLHMWPGGSQVFRVQVGILP